MSSSGSTLGSRGETETSSGINWTHSFLPINARLFSYVNMVSEESVSRPFRADVRVVCLPNDGFLFAGACNILLEGTAHAQPGSFIYGRLTKQTDRKLI